MVQHMPQGTMYHASEPGSKWTRCPPPPAMLSRTTGIYATEILPSSILAGSAWHRHVYRLYSGSGVNQSSCQLMCGFDYLNADGNRCHFTIFSASGVCHLGTLGAESSLLTETIDASEIQLKTGLYAANCQPWTCKY